jgi:DNA-binding protein HU-beta
MQTETKFSLRVMRFNSVNLILGEHMNKSELIDALSEETTFSKKDIAKVLAAFTRIVERTLQKGEKVAMTGFGTYWISHRPERVGINPATKERISLPAVSVPRFKPGKHLKEQVRGV